MTASALQFGPYQLLRRLGTGGMAETFVAVRRGQGGVSQTVCLKRILPGLETDPDFVSMFMREARVSARLRHNNIAQVLDFGIVEDSHFLALEMVDGMDLRALIAALRQNAERLDPGLVIFIAYELAFALDFAHAADSSGHPAGVVHRDISCANVLLSRAGEVKLTDFGIAKALNQPGLTRSGMIKGKIPYMAPEYAARGQFDARSDLFSLGVTLYEALSGVRPFGSSSDGQTLRRILAQRYTPLHELGIEAPQPLIHAIHKLLSAEPNERYANAGELLDAMKPLSPPPAARRTLGQAVRRFGDSHTSDRIKASAPDAQTRTRFTPFTADD